jgi:sigma-B regulation protein RsbU (phosphoserine phosphatase)
MLPTPPKLERFEFHCVYQPASKLGGDFYDFVNVSEDKLGIVCGDVSGHGLDAAIVMGMAKKTINIFGRGEDSPKETLSLANQDLYADLDDMTFVSAFYGVLDQKTAVLRHCRAGHNPTFLIRDDGKAEVEELKPKGIVLGMQREPVFGTFTEELETSLKPGDVLFQYTDGLIEAKSKSGEEFGSDRLKTLLAQHATKNIDHLVETVSHIFGIFIDGTEQDDDVTLMGLKVLK